jgi:hypothetical protein
MVYKMTKNVFSCVLFHAWSNALYSVFEIEISSGLIISYAVEIIVAVLICLLMKKREISCKDANVVRGGNAKMSRP